MIRKTQPSILVLLLLLTLFLAACGSETSAPMDGQQLQQQVFDHLQQVRTQKQDKLLRYLQAQQEAATRFANDPQLLPAFRQLHGAFSQQQKNTQEWQQAEALMENYFVNHLGEFYDLLLVAPSGEIFFTLRREKDFGRNIHDPMFQGLGLHRALADPPTQLTFVDFEHYRVSAEPASFYLLPLFDGNTHLGTAVLQLPINTLNLYLSDRRSLGRSGEVYLVNRRQLMLNQSRFIDDITVLKKRIDTEAVRDMNNGGHKLIRDYRNQWVYSSYDRIHYEGAEWMLVAEQDEQEVLAEHLYRHLDILTPELLTALPAPDSQPASNSWPNATRVDIKELSKSRTQPLLTRGVATCTAVAAWRPGHFAYLAHISPTDAIYIDSERTRDKLGDEYSDFLDTLLGQIRHYDIVPYQQNELQFVIAANHSDSFRLSVRRLLEEGITPEQMRLLHAPFAESLDMLISPAGSGGVRYMHQGRLHEVALDKLPTLSALLKQVINYPSRL